jgi:hypothetical protein
MKTKIYLIALVIALSSCGAAHNVVSRQKELMAVHQAKQAAG